MNKVLLLASGMSAKQYHDYPYKENGWTIVAVNNGWQVTDEWDHWVRPPDYRGVKPKEYLEHQSEVKRYSTQLNMFGGQKACGYSITLNAGYWALGELKPDIIGLLGADMNYTPDEDGNTHIYGVGYDIKTKGVSDPDRMVKVHGNNDPEYLNTIYMRLVEYAEKQNCKVYNLSRDIETRLPYERVRPEDL